MRVIAIDGPGGAGKSTVARAVAERLGVSHLDKGANWLVLPDGLIVELIPASPGTVQAVLAVNPRA